MHDLDPDELDEIYRFAIQVGKEAGSILLRGLEERQIAGPNHVEDAVEKLNAVDIVTKTDNGAHSSTQYLAHVLSR
jgi:myo-inositol-1(or 4)-monophosphatase